LDFNEFFKFEITVPYLEQRQSIAYYDIYKKEKL